MPRVAVNQRYINVQNYSYALGRYSHVGNFLKANFKHFL